MRRALLALVLIFGTACGGEDTGLMQPELVNLYGRVHSAETRLWIEGATVTALSTGARAITTFNGVFRLCCFPPGSRQGIRIEHLEFETLETSVEVPPLAVDQTVIDFYLTPRPVEGATRSEDRGSPSL